MEIGWSERRHPCLRVKAPVQRQADPRTRISGIADDPLMLNAVDVHDTPLPGLSTTLTAVYTGVVAGPAAIFINEWMAANTRTLADLSSGTPKYDDWFELYNPSDTAVDLKGYFLTDTLRNPSQFQVPAGYFVPPRGYLLVWADNEASQNTTSQPELHVNFQLAAKGEAIGQFAPDGTLMDSVTFQAQADDVSEGRLPDGGSTILPMTRPTPAAANSGPALRFDWTAVPGRALTLHWDTSPGSKYWIEARADLATGS